jgi:DNA-binding Lrp family transcriptional regulator
MTQQQIKLKVFKALCQHNCDFMCSWIPLPTTVIANLLNVSLYQCRKQMKQLVKDGLAESCSCVLDREESLLPYHGFKITAKGRKTDIAKYCELKHARICAECFGGDVKEWLASDFDKRWLGREERQ